MHPMLSRHVLAGANNVNNILSQLRAHPLFDDSDESLSGWRDQLLLVPLEQHLELLLLVVPSVVLRDGHNDRLRETEVAGEAGPARDGPGCVDQLLSLQWAGTNPFPQRH